MKSVKFSTQGLLVIPNENRLTPLPIFPVTSVDEVAGMLTKRGSNKSEEINTRAKIAKTLKARDAVTRK